VCYFVFLGSRSSCFWRRFGENIESCIEHKIHTAPISLYFTLRVLRNW